MGKMGDAATLGGVAIAAFIVYKLAGFKFEMPKFEFPTLFAPSVTVEMPRARDLFDIPEPGERDFWVDDTPDVPTEVFTEILDVYKAKGETFAEVSAYHTERVQESRAILDQATIDLARFKTYLNGNADVDAGGSTDMLPPSERYVNGVWLEDH